MKQHYFSTCSFPLQWTVGCTVFVFCEQEVLPIVFSFVFLPFPSQCTLRQHDPITCVHFSTEKWTQVHNLDRIARHGCSRPLWDQTDRQYFQVIIISSIYLPFISKCLYCIQGELRLLIRGALPICDHCLPTSRCWSRICYSDSWRTWTLVVALIYPIDLFFDYFWRISSHLTHQHLILQYWDQSTWLWI